MRVRILKPLMASLVLATAGAVSTPAWAGSASADLLVTATVIPSCVISTTPVAFGVYDPVVTNSATAVDSSGTVTIACTKGSSQTITLDQGSNADGSTRRFSGGHVQRITGTVHYIKDSEDGVPAYGRLVIVSDPRAPESPIGVDGLFYFENVSPGQHHARLEYDGAACELDLTVPASDEPSVSLGDLSCALPGEKRP